MHGDYSHTPEASTYSASAQTDSLEKKDTKQVHYQRVLGVMIDAEPKWQAS